MFRFGRRGFLLSWMIGGAQGSGVDSSANLFAYSISSAGYYIFGKREYYSNIKGEHSYFNVVASERPVNAVVDPVHILSSFDAETVFRHAWEVVEGGAIIYDASQEGESLKNIPTIEERLRGELSERLRDAGVGETLKDVLKVAERRGVRLYPIPYMDLVKRTGEVIGEQQLTLLMRVVNTMAVAASFAIMRADINRLHRGLTYAFRAKKAVVDMNFTACKVVYDYVKQNFPDDFPISLPTRPLPDRLVLINGTSCVGIAKIVAGCRVQTYYPITPAADESVYLEDKQVFRVNAFDGDELEYPHLAENRKLADKGHILVVQTEDELAAIDMAVSASLAGARAATSTSGPGFSLMVEGLGWAGMNEVPVVITIYQRGGPSTGLPTRHEQGDLLFSVFAGHGEFPRIVMASGDMEEAFYDTVKAFNYAEKFQLPVIHLLDKSLANSTQTIHIPRTSDIILDRGMLINEHLDEKSGYKRFKFTDNNISPRTPLGTRGGIFWNTGDEHDELGHISEDPVIRTRMMNKRMEKLELVKESIPLGEKIALYGDQDADTWIISWGSTKGPIIDALEILEGDGIDSVGFLQLKILYPFPSEACSEILSNAKRIIDLEQNYSGQMAKLLTMETRIVPTNWVLKYNGRPFTSTEVADGVKEVLLRNTKRLVTNRGG
jgi:2-oxoglutarate/2-oxoacid ferredoxin oxidoreductase subunit alpha